MNELSKRLELFDTQEIRNRFENLYTPEPNSGCWIWEGSVKQGRMPYGRISKGRKTVPAHRLSLWIHRGPFQESLWVLHKCDNPTCVNPDHLFLGVAKDNSADRDKKDRHAYGVKNGRAVLTESDVRLIRSSSETNRVLGERYGVDPSHISHVRLKKNWARTKDTP